MSRKIWIGIVSCLLIGTLWLSLQTATPGQSTSVLESQVSRIETENRNLRSRLNQLESQVSRLSINAGIEDAPPIAPERSPSTISSLAEDPTFKRLATLVIELKERVVEVETAIARIAPAQSLPSP
jgi:hypothetical protein